MFHVVRRSLAAAGLTGLLLVAGGAAAYADDPLPPDNPATTTDCGLPPNDTDQGIAVGEPAPGTDVVDPVPADVPPGEPKPDQPVSSDTGTATITPPEQTIDPGLNPDVICIASAVAPGSPVADTGGGGEAVVPVSAPVPQLPRTGPAPLQPTLALGAWLLLLGLLATLAGRRRTARP
jgi:hypothetical protein